MVCYRLRLFSNNKRCVHNTTRFPVRFSGVFVATSKFNAQFHLKQTIIILVSQSQKWFSLCSTADHHFYTVLKALVERLKVCDN